MAASSVPGYSGFRAGNELEFAAVSHTQRCVGTKINKVYEVPAGWDDGPTERLEDLAPAGDVLLVMQPDTTLDLSPSYVPNRTYIQQFKKTEELVEVLKEQTPEALQDIMGLGSKMAKSHLDRFKGFEKLPPKQACLMFGGKKMEAESWNSRDQKFAEGHLRYLTGLYGVLRPYDDVKPVRDLPMGAKLKTKRGSYITEFWGDACTKLIIKDLEELGKKAKGRLKLVTCLTEEYMRAVHVRSMPSNVETIQVEFEGANEEYTRKGRSLFARHVVRRKVDDMDGLRGFDHDDWALDQKKSSPYRIVFKWDGEAEFAAKEKKKDKKVKKDVREPSRSGSPDDNGFVPGVIQGNSDSEEPAPRKSRKDESRKEKSSRRAAPEDDFRPGVTAGSDDDAPQDRRKRKEKERHRDRSASPRGGGGSRRSRAADTREASPDHSRAKDKGGNRRRRADDSREPSPAPRSRKHARQRSRS